MEVPQQQPQAPPTTARNDDGPFTASQQLGFEDGNGSEPVRSAKTKRGTAQPQGCKTASTIPAVLQYQQPLWSKTSHTQPRRQAPLKFLIRTTVWRGHLDVLRVVQGVPI